MKRAVAAFGLLFIGTLPAHASEAHLKEGNRLFRSGRYEEALKKYNEGLMDAPNSSQLRYNAGDAAYQMNDFASAEKQFQEAADRTPHPPLRGAAHYNKGNALFRQQKWKEAVEAYKDSLRANPADEDAKYNLGVALDVMKNPASAKAMAGKPEDKKGKGKKDKEKGEGKEKAQEQGARPGEMSKEDAERLLSAAGSGEMKKNNKAKEATAAAKDEDW